MPKVASCFLCVSVVNLIAVGAGAAPLRAGAFAQDITPAEFPVIVNGGFLEASATKANDRLHARALVLDDGTTKIAIVVVDSCMLPRELCDDAKERASKVTGIPVDRILISATHTHSAPSAMGCLGSDVDEKYVRGLPGLLAAAIEKANGRLGPAKVGWAVTSAPEMTATRRYVFRLDRPRNDPFGQASVFANMHPGYSNPDAIGPTGPTDPGVSVVSVRHAGDGRPLAVLANFSMHYVGGVSPVSSDYFGLFCEKIGKLMRADESFVGIMSQGTSGDAWLADYSKPVPKERWNVETFSTAMAAKVHGALKGMEYREEVTLGMKEATLKLRRRTPDEKRLAWARERVEKMGGVRTKPKTQAEVYAREAIFLHEEPERELKLQAIRIGDLGITAIPNEVYALTGLKLKAMSPLPVTFNVSLANGSEGYIPPAEQFRLGGYTTWPARTAGLGVGAEAAIVESVLKLLEEVSGGKRRAYVEGAGDYARAVLGSKPWAYYGMGELTGRVCGDVAGMGRRGRYESGVLFHLPGVEAAGLAGSRAAHFAGGRMETDLAAGGTPYTVEFWFWNGLGHEARAVTAYLFSRGVEGNKEAAGDHLGIGGSYEGGAYQGKLIFFNGNRRNEVLAGKTVVPPKTWHHVALVRDRAKVGIYLNGELEVAGNVEVTGGEARQVFFGGRCDGFANLQGKLDEVAIFERALVAGEVAGHYKAAGMPPARARADVKRSSDPLSPAESMKKIHLVEGYGVELVAAEPVVVDPVAIDWGPDGRLWVVEMHDYPYGMDGKGKAGGRIKFLEDVDGDGRYEKATVFLDGVRMPTGVLAWRDGVLVTAAPEILFARDADGDGKAEKGEVLFAGFKEGNPQLRVNGLRWGLDGWVYCANGWSAGVVTSKKTGEKVDLKGKDLRIRPDTGEMELVSGVSQFGRERDDFGRWFGVDNAHPLFHYVYEDRYLRRNPHLPAAEAKVQLLGDRPPRVYPRSVLQKRYIGLDHHGHYTSACGMAIVRDDFFGGVGALHALICEPVHNLVQHQVLFEEGETFVARRAADEREREFIASEDPWFKPVMVRVGPDGALWVVDMYRYLVEHPDWLDAIGKRELAPYYRDGDDKGRIYRVYRKDGPRRKAVRLAGLSGERLVALLESPGGHTRDQAQMMLLWRADAAAVPPLERLVAESKSAAARIAALWTLAGLADRGISGVKSGTLMAALRDAHPFVRVNALQIAEPRLSDDGRLLNAVCALAGDSDLRVRAQVAFTLGESADAKAGEALARLAVAAGGEKAVSAAVLSSAGRHFGSIVRAVGESDLKIDSDLNRGLLEMAVAMKDRASTARLLRRVCPEKGDQATHVHFAELARFLDSISSRKITPEQLRQGDDELSVVLTRAKSMFQTARATAADDRADAGARQAAMALLGREAEHRGAELALIGRLLLPSLPGELQSAAVRAAARTGDDAVPGLLLKGWGTHSPSLRIVIADVLLSRQAWTLELVRSAAARDLDFSRRQRLINHSNAEIKKIAKASLDQPAATSADRQRVIDEYQAALSSAKSDLGRGKQVYLENCATCHKSGADGQDIGPSLLSVRDWTKENLLAAILDPDRTVEPRYLAYGVTTQDDQTLTGVITAESAAGLTIKTLDAKEHHVPRTAIKSLASTGHSLMPQGFESAMSPKDVSDLIAFIQSTENR